MATMQKVNIDDKLARIGEHWRPKVVGELNGQQVKLVKFRGRFVWHVHEDADELFMPLHGSMRIEFRDRVVELGPGEFFIVPAGVEHRTAADTEVSALLVHPAGTRNTGDKLDPNLTAPTEERI